MMKKGTVPAIAGALVLLSATVALASGGEGGHHVDSGVLLKDFLYRIFNFAIMAAILVYFLKKPIRNGLKERRDGIEKALAKSEAARKDAEAKFAEYDRKLTEATSEIDELSAAIRKEGESEKARIIAEAQAAAVKIKADAEKAAALEVAKAKTALREEASRLAISVAEELLKEKCTADDQNRLVDEYMKQVGELH